MRVTFLGTGTSQGVPVIGVDDPVCHSLDPRDKRLRASVLIEVEGMNWVIDTGPDFRQQMLRERVNRLDALLFTHQHKDHTAGLDDIRPFYFRQRHDIPLYASSDVIAQLKQEFAYMFAAFRYPGVAAVELHEISNKPFAINGVQVLPIQVMHHKLPVFGFRIKGFTYITDANYISPEELEKAKGSEVLVLNALHRKPHISHYNLEQALEVIESLAPKHAYLTHMSFAMGFHAEVSEELPSNVSLAHDGLSLTLND